MRILRLEVQNFRGIRSAELDFGPGLNIFHGPNELGKSTLAEAVRAALLMPKSKHAESYLRWDGIVPTTVTLTFAAGDAVWRVGKKFSAPFTAVLEQQSGSAAGKFREVANGRLVDEKLRDLLCWGIAPPGGKGAAAKPISYLVVALLGRQGEVEQILDASLASDQDETGKVSIIEALGALGSDPRVTEIVERLTERVDAVFTRTEKLKQTAESPLVKLQEKLRSAEKALIDLLEDNMKSRAIGTTVVSLQDEWLRLSDQLKEAEAVLAAAQRRHDQNKTREELQTVIDDCRARLTQVEQLSARLQALRGDLADTVAVENAERATMVAADLALKSLSTQVQEALEDVVRAQATHDRAALEDQSDRQQRRAVLIEQKAALEGRLRAVDSAAVGAANLAGAESDLLGAMESVVTTEANVERAAAALDYSTWSAELRGLAEAEALALQLQGASADASLREEGAATDVKQAETDLAAAQSYRARQGWTAHPTAGAITAELDQLLRAQLRLRIAELLERVAGIEAHDEHRKSSLETARQNRDEASRLERQVAASVLPTEEQVASWREWEAQLAEEPKSTGGRLGAAATAGLVGLATGVVTAAAVLLTNGSSANAAIVGLVVAILSGALTWYRASSRGRLAATGLVSRRSTQERLSLEVQPALRRAGLTSLSAFEGARDALERMRSDANRLRVEAGQEDQEAARAAEQAAPLGGLRHELAELMKQDQPVDQDAANALLDEFDRDAEKVRSTIDAKRERLNALTMKLSQDADAAVAATQRYTEQKKVLHGQVVKEAAAAKAQHDVALQRCDPTRTAQLRGLIAASGLAAETPLAQESTEAGLERAKVAAYEASARADELQRQIDSMRPAVEQRLATLGESPESARSKADAELSEVETQLALLTQLPTDTDAPTRCYPSDALTAAIRRRDQLNVQLSEARANVENAAASVSGAAEATVEVGKRIALAEGELKAIDRADLETRLRTAGEDPVFQDSDAGGPDMVTALDSYESATAKRHDCEGRLNAAKGQLHLVGGHVVAERLARQEEVVSFARQEYEEKELTEKAALRLLNEIKTAEAEATSHLGRTLAGPVTTMLADLTSGRYGSIEFSTDLTAGGVIASGAQRELSDLSVGTREQLATLIRLAIAAQLETSLLLDDQLVHSDTERLGWFREQLCKSARDRQHQIIVFTCRPGDYIAADGADADYPVNVVDLEPVVEV